MSQSYETKWVAERLKFQDNSSIYKKKLRIVQQANKYNMNTNAKIPISLYSTTNSEIPSTAKAAQIDISSVRRNCSIPYIHRKVVGFENETNPEYQNLKQQIIQPKFSNSAGVRSHSLLQPFDQDYVLSPSKVSKMKGNFIMKSANKYPNSQNFIKQKVVILSSSNCKNIRFHKNNNKQDILGNVYQNVNQILKLPIKLKIKQKIINNLNVQPKCNTQFPINKQKAEQNPLHTFENIIKNKIKQKQQQKYKEGQKKRPASSSKIRQQELVDKINNQQKQINMKQLIETDKQILKLFPRVDLTALIFKIKVQEQARKQMNIKKWSHFDYQNLSEYQM